MTVSAKPTLILKRSEIAGLMSTSDYVAAVEAAFRCYATGGAEVPMPMHIGAENGGFHAKGARVAVDQSYVAIKVNANFPKRTPPALRAFTGEQSRTAWVVRSRFEFGLR